MKCLLDTSVWLWSLTASERIRPEGRALIARGGEEIYLSAATSWEIAIKSALGKLPLPEPVASFVPKRMAAQALRPLAVMHSHALRVAELPNYHNDPFDRLLIAQAQVEGMVILTADRAFKSYPVEILWCGN